MEIRIDAPDKQAAAQADQLLKFYLTGLGQDIGRVRVCVQRQQDPLGAELHRCRVEVVLNKGQLLDIDETQSDLALAIMRAFGRAARTTRRLARYGRPVYPV
jgi:hypothetical protein